MHNRNEAPPEFAPDYGLRQPSVIPEGLFESDEYIADMEQQMRKRFGLESIDGLNSFDVEEEEPAPVIVHLCEYLYIYIYIYTHKHIYVTIHVCV